jgi:hypothetical protein
MAKPTQVSMAALIAVFILIGMSLSIFPASATIFFEDGSNRTISELYTMTNGSQPTDSAAPAVFFFDPNCSACTPAHEYLTAYITAHPDIPLELVDLSENPAAEDRLNTLYISHNREWMNIPVMFIGPVGLEGTNEIITDFEGVNSWYTRKDMSQDGFWNQFLKNVNHFLGFA